MHRTYCTLALLYVLFSGMPCYSYQETITHPNMSELAIRNSRLGSTLTGQLFLPSGLLTEIPTVVGGATPGSSKTIMKWLRLGSEEEDKPMCRASNHFHNPLNTKPWENSYLIDWPDSFGSYCDIEGWGNRYSNIVWATGFSSPAPYGEKTTTPNPWSWDRARLSYENACSARTVAEREQYLADAFLNLGHILHLLQDMAVPAHVRSDFKSHLSRIGIRGTDLTNWPYEPYEDYVRENNYVLLPESLVPIRPSFLDKKTLTNYWDTNVYEATCTHVAPRLAGPYLGLAEYTNANFLSTNTIFTEDAACTNSYYFPHPRRDETDYDPQQLPEELSRAEDGVTDRVHYIHIIDPPEGLGAGENEKRAVAALRYLARYRIFQPWPYYVSEFYTDDDEVHKATAGRLLPRAVGYSASLLDYFFRGRFDAKDVNTSLVETLSPASIRLNFKNASGEAFVNGTVYLYQDSGEEGEIGKTNLLEAIAVAPGVILDDGATFGGQEFKNITVTVPSGKSITDLVFTLMYVGQLGWEENAVVAKRFKAPPPPELPSVINVGDNPHGMALTPLRDKLYVANYSANTVSVINTAQRRVVATIPVGSSPTDVAIARNRAFVSNERGNSVSVIDIASDTVEQTITGIPPWPEEMAVTPDGNFVYLAHWSSRPLTKINAATLAYDLIPSPLKPCQGIAIQGTSAYLTYYTFYWRQSVGVVNLNSQGLRATIPGPDLNWSAAISGSSLYVAHPQINAVSAYNTADNTLIATLPVGGSPRGVTAGSDGKVYVARLLDDKVTVIDPSDNSQKEIVAGDGAYDVVVDNQAGYLYVSNAFADTVSVIPLSGGAAPRMAMAGASMMSDATPTEASSLATVVLNDFPPDGRVLIDGEFPRGETLLETGREVLMTPGIHELLLACPGYLTKTIAVNTLPGEYIVEDGLLAAE